MLIAVGNVVRVRKSIIRRQTELIILFAMVISVGATVDLFVEHSFLVWPCFCSSLLYCYFFIVRQDSRLDSLTGIYNRRCVDEFLHALSNPKRNREYAFVLIDIDRFKYINDKYGHIQGDEALCNVAEVLRGSMRRSDFVARCGGDEFLIITTATKEIKQIISRIQGNIERFNDQSDAPYTISLSMGYAIYELASDMSPLEFLDHVDHLMYGEKDRRRKPNVELVARADAGVASDVSGGGMQ